MDFSLSEEQQLLKDSVARYCADQTGETSLSQKWSEFAQLGWLAMPFPEQQGGLDGGIVESCILAGELGRHAITSPFVSSVLVAGRLLAESPEPSAAQLLSALMNGEKFIGLGLYEHGYNAEAETWQCQAQQGEAGWRISGRKVLAVCDGADEVVIVARMSERAVLSAFTVPADAPGVQRQSVYLMDGSVRHNLLLNNVEVSHDRCLFHDGGIDERLTLILEDAAVAMAAEGIAAMESLLSATVEYARNRKQFGVAIGSFQALQHRMVDMYADVELCKAMLLRAQCAVLDCAPDRPEVVSALKFMVGGRGRKLAEEAVQLHGGMGVSDEMPVGRYLKRLMMIDSEFGGIELQRRRFCEQRYANADESA